MKNKKNEKAPKYTIGSYGDVAKVPLEDFWTGTTLESPTIPSPAIEFKIGIVLPKSASGVEVFGEFLLGEDEKWDNVADPYKFEIGGDNRSTFIEGGIYTYIIDYTDIQGRFNEILQDFIGKGYTLFVSSYIPLGAELKEIAPSDLIILSSISNNVYDTETTEAFVKQRNRGLFLDYAKDGIPIYFLTRLLKTYGIFPNITTIEMLNSFSGITNPEEKKILYELGYSFLIVSKEEKEMASFMIGGEQGIIRYQELIVSREAKLIASGYRGEDYENTTGRALEGSLEDKMENLVDRGIIRKVNKVKVKRIEDSSEENQRNGYFEAEIEYVGLKDIMFVYINIKRVL